MSATSTFLGRPAPAWSAPLACGCCLAAGAAYVAVQDPAEGGVFVPCPFRTLTGWWCPGCGLTRATHYLLRGQLADAFRFNLLVVFVVAAIALSWASWLLSVSGRSLLGGRALPRWTVAAMIVLAVAYAVARNLPGVDGLRG